MTFEEAMADVEQGESAWRHPWSEDELWVGIHPSSDKIYLFTETTILHPWTPTDDDRSATDWDTTKET